MHDPGCATALASDKAALARTLGAAFRGYPLTEWLVGSRPGGRQRRERYFGLLLDDALRRGVVLRDAESKAVAIWYPPGVWEIGVGDFLRTLPDWLRIVGVRALPGRLRALSELVKERPTAEGTATGRAWVLEVLGVDPDAQRTGRGSRLLEAGLARAREDGAGAFLLTSSEDAIPFYERHGFVVEKAFAVRGGPPMWTLCREP